MESVLSTATSALANCVKPAKKGSSIKFQKARICSDKKTKHSVYY